jgi:SpoU rRNA methylase family enzyme
MAFWECSFHFLFVSALRDALNCAPPEVIFLFYNTWGDFPKIFV